MKKSKETVSNWDGKCILYLPSFERYSKTNKKDPNFHLEISSAKELNIPVIDIHKEVFAFHPNPLSLFLLKDQVIIPQKHIDLLPRQLKNELSQMVMFQLNKKSENTIFCFKLNYFFTIIF